MVATDVSVEPLRGRISEMRGRHLNKNAGVL